MASLTLRLVKGSTLTFSETDGNFTSLNNEKIERDGSIPFTGAQPFVAGTVSAPGITIAGDTNTGVYSPAADQLAITCGGTQRGLFSSSGLTVTGTISGTLSGDGSAVTNLNASNISTGTLADARLSSNVPLKNAANTFTANQTINAGLTVTGTISGTLSGDGSAIINLNASNISTGTLVDARLSSNVPLKNVGGTFTGEIAVDAGPNSGLTVRASSTAQMRLECTGATTDNKNWIIYAAPGSLQIRPYTDNYSSSTAAMTISRSGSTAGTMATYGSLLVGANQVSTGYVGVQTGGGSSSGFTAFFSPSGTRVGYIGNATTFGTGDNGTLPYIAGTHAFTGDISVTGTISGSGSGLTSLNASNISSGTLSDARLSSNIALKNAANTFTANQTLSVGASSIFTINSSGSPQLRLENTSASTNNKNWIVYTDTTSLQIRPYTDDYASSTAALSIARSGVTAGVVQTYSNVNVGANQSGIGQLGAVAGTTGRSGFVAFINPSGGREGYIGFSPTTGGGDVGTIEYIAGRHDFAGRANTRPVSVAFSATPTFDSSLSNTIYFGTMTANVTSMTISNPVDGAQLQIRFVQDATGGRTVTLPSSVQVSGSLNTAANAVTWLVLTYVSSASRWEGTWTRIS